MYLQAELMYPHIATSDAKASTNATWLRTLTNRGFHFDQWESEKAFKALIGLKGEKAIFNGDILPSPAGLLLGLLCMTVQNKLSFYQQRCAS